MGHQRDPIIGYCSRLVGGLIAFAVAAATFHEFVAALAILAVVMAVVLATASLIVRGDL